ncbi:hypothetical protein SAMN05660464_3504 [Geodermatophilus dictyosporus]|uniref:Uncharacterized protein n=1 Tax=Geodermatophilus dictyosporus TaxID=1523247 RepID=A0A1I5R6B6_9ACTN|nr:hypothetical protein [Geodermatophilus dictyosporus]SFP53995.1 hypothetical protein SAMN05660464_3504 [Geodermatophilus dictyosporus]
MTEQPAADSAPPPEAPTPEPAPEQAAATQSPRKRTPVRRTAAKKAPAKKATTGTTTRRTRTAAAAAPKDAITAPAGATGGKPDEQRPPAEGAQEELLKQVVVALGALQGLSALQHLTGLTGLASLPTIAQQQVDAATHLSGIAQSTGRLQQESNQHLAALVDRLPVPQQAMTPEQWHVANQFQALRSSLGGGHRIGSPDVVPAMRPPQVASDGTVTLQDGLPSGASSVVVTYVDQADGALKQKQLTVRSPGQTSFDPGVGAAARVVGVEVQDKGHRSLQFGIPT